MEYGGSRGARRPIAGSVLAASALVAAPMALIVMFAVAVAAPTPAGAHARIVGSSPEDGTTVDAMPAEVALEVDAKPATIEGDPLQVYAPDGRRVDLDDPRVSEEGHRITVGIGHDQQLPGGEYQIAYRLVSADSHVISGRLSFTARVPVDGRGAATAAAAQDRAGSGSRSLIPGRPEDLRPPLVAAGALALAALTLLVPRRRRTHAVAQAAKSPRSRQMDFIHRAVAPEPGARPRLGARERVRPTRAHRRPPRPRHGGATSRPAGAGADRYPGSRVERAFWGERGTTTGRGKTRRRDPAPVDAWWLDDGDGAWH